MQFHSETLNHAIARLFGSTDLPESLKPVWADNKCIILLVMAYVAIARILLADGLVLSFDFGILIGLFLLFSFSFLLFNANRRLYLSFRYAVGALTILLLAPIFAASFASFKQRFHLINVFRWDEFLMNLDYRLHFNHHPWQMLEPILDSGFLLRFVDMLYMIWFVVLVFFCLAMAWTKRRKLRILFFVSTLLVWMVLGSGLGSLFSSAGPCYYAHVSQGENPFAPLMDRLQRAHETKRLWAVENQIGIWQARESRTWLPFGGISAMPSIHVAMAMIFALTAFAVKKWLGVIFGIYLLAIQIGSVVLGWHYAIDGYVGMGLAALIWVSVKRLIKPPPAAIEAEQAG